MASDGPFPQTESHVWAVVAVFLALLIGLVATLNQRNAALKAQATADQNAERATPAAEAAKEARDAAETSARSEKQAKTEALVSLGASYVNLGFVEAEKQKYAESQLWFAKAAEITADPRAKAVEAMRAHAYGRSDARPIRLFADRAPPSTPVFAGTEHQLALDPSNRFLRYRMLIHIYEGGQEGSIA